METTIEPQKPTTLFEYAELCLKAAVATVGVLGAFALVGEVNKRFGGSDTDQKTEE